MFVHATEDCPNLMITNEWDAGIDYTLQFVVDHEAHGWEIVITFDKPIVSLACWQVSIYSAMSFYQKAIW